MSNLSEKAKKRGLYWTGGPWCDWVTEQAERIEELERAPQWTLVEDALPKDDSLCWVYYSDSGVDQDWFVDGEWCVEGPLTHWMYANHPEPPTEASLGEKDEG